MCRLRTADEWRGVAKADAKSEEHTVGPEHSPFRYCACIAGERDRRRHSPPTDKHRLPGTNALLQLATKEHCNRLAGSCEGEDPGRITVAEVAAVRLHNSR